MLKRYSLSLFFVILVLIVTTADAEEHSYVPKRGFVPDERTAVLIAEAVLSPIYGEERIANEKPFAAALKGDVWIVQGSLPAGKNLGGVALAEISKADGRILRVTHGK
jgi:hypothetical protein